MCIAMSMTLDSQTHRGTAKLQFFLVRLRRMRNCFSSPNANVESLIHVRSSQFLSQVGYLQPEDRFPTEIVPADKLCMFHSPNCIPGTLPTCFYKGNNHAIYIKSPLYSTLYNKCFKLRDTVDSQDESPCQWNQNLCLYVYLSVFSSFPFGHRKACPWSQYESRKTQWQFNAILFNNLSIGKKENK